MNIKNNADAGKYGLPKEVILAYKWKLNECKAYSIDYINIGGCE